MFNSVCLSLNFNLNIVIYVDLITGGYAGRSALLALHKVGLSATLFENADTAGAVNYSPDMPVGIWSNGLACLKELEYDGKGVSDDFKKLVSRHGSWMTNGGYSSLQHGHTFAKPTDGISRVTRVISVYINVFVYVHFGLYMYVFTKNT